MTGDTLQGHIDEVMDEFDFGKVQKVMEFLNWRWVGADEGVPREAELRKKVRELMSYTYNQGRDFQKDWLTATGGFRVEYHYEWDFFEVGFYVTQWSTEYLTASEEPPF